MSDLQAKVKKLNSILEEWKSAVIGFSGGADSAFLSVAARILGEKVIAVRSYGSQD